jgi:hypothetical protein
MKNILLTLILLSSLINYAQNNDNIEPIEEYERVYVEFGQIIPFGDFAKQMDKSLHYGFWIRTKIKHNNFMDFGLNFYIPKDAQPIQVFKKGEFHTYESTDFTFSIGGRLSKVFKISENVNVEWVSGFGIKFLTYKTPNTLILTEEEQADEKNKEDNVLLMPNLSQGIRWNYKNVGLQVHYHLGDASGNLDYKGNIGNTFLTFGIVYRQ